MSSNLQLVSQQENDQERAEYAAFKTANKTQRKLMLVDGQGNIIGMPSYQHYMNALSTQPGKLWIVFNPLAYSITGVGVETLLNYLQDDRLRSLHCYNPSRHLPLQANDIRIDAITQHSLKEFTLGQPANGNSR